MIKAIVMLVTMSMASLALAEDGAERTLARMEAARQVSMQAYKVAQQKKEQAPVAAQTIKATKHENC